MTARLQRVDVETHDIRDYVPFVGEERVDELVELARALGGARIVHLNATAYGGGVSELLRSLVPIYRGLGLDAEWRVITGDERFFRATKDLHNALQGAELDLDAEEREAYLSTSARNARALGTWDVVVAHDPQTAALRTHREGDGTWIWRCHIDTSTPHPGALELLGPFVAAHDALVFTLEEFMPPAWDHPVVRTMPPGIDPLAPKNMDLPRPVHDQIARWLGVNPERPILCQVSRFDPWKDPLGVVAVYRRVRQEVGDLQLALLGSMALDDPEGWDLLERVQEEVRGDDDIHVGTNMTGVSNIEVNAFQRASTVVVQKSIREGFGLVVSESLWKSTPVVAGRAGGIPVQMPEGSGGYIADTEDAYVEAITGLLRDPERARAAGESGREHVRERFLITRLAADELRLLLELG